MTPQEDINNINLNPKTLFLIDGFGAIVSAFLLGVILTRYESSFGMPRKTLYFLSFLPCLFAIYDFIIYSRITENWKPYLKAIALANLAYCCLSIGFIFYHYEKLTSLGLIYFLLELAIIIILVNIQFKMLK